MSIHHSLQILAALSLWAATALSQAAPARTVSAMISAESSTPALQQCDSICTLMAYPVPGVESSLFASYCEGTGRTDCGVDKMQFKIDFVGAGTAAGQTLSFGCTCDLPPPGPSLSSSQSPTASVGSSSESPTTLPASRTAETTAGITSTVFSSVSPSGSSSVSPSLSSTSTATATSTNTTKTPTATGKPTEPAKSTAAPPKAEGGTSKGTIVGIVVGVLCILACSGAGVLAIYRRRQKKKVDQGYIDSFRACSEIQRAV